MTTPHGIIEVVPSDPTNSYRTREMFVSLQMFLTSSYAVAAGITRIACQSNGAGGGFDYVNTGNNAFAVYEWTAATKPFYVMFHLSMSGTLGTPGLPALIDGVSNVFGTCEAIGVSVAMRSDGGNPWNGTTFDNGYDTKGTPVWTSGGSDLLVWPRSNAAGGNTATNAENMVSLFGIVNNAPITDPVHNPVLGSRFHFLCDQENFASVSSPDGDYRNHHVFFGRYNPVHGTEATNLFPYAMIASKQYSVNFDPSVIYTTYGSTVAGSIPFEGGIAHTSDPSQGVKSVYLCAQDGFLNAGHQPNTTMSPATYDEMPFWLAMNEGPNWSIAGTTDFFRAVFGPFAWDTTYALDRAVFGTYNATGRQMYTVPWNAAVAPGTSWSSRSGTMF